jgi:DNA-binding beta-propeller fold protein YncE
MKTILSFILALPLLAQAGGIFWSDRPSGSKSIRGGNFDGSNVHNVVTLASTRDPRGIVVDAANERLYYCDRAASTSTSGEINYVAISGAGGVQPALATLNRPADLRFNPATRLAYWCEENGGLIRSVVLPSPGGVIPPGNVLALFTGQTSPYYLDYDLAAGQLWWGTSGSQILRGPLTGGVSEVRYAAGLNVRGVCVDSAGGFLYWCERDGTHVIHRATLDGGAVQDVYTGLDTPHGLVLDFAARKLYWADTGTNAVGGFNARGISRGDMDGTTPAEIVVAGTAANQPWDLDLDRRNASYAEWAARFFRYDATNKNRTDDPDDDGLKNVMEYALGSGPLAPNSPPTNWVRVTHEGVDYPAIQFRRRGGTNDLTVLVQVSTDLATWKDNTIGAFTTETSTIAQEDGMELVTVRSNSPMTTSPQHLRLKVSVP